AQPDAAGAAPGGRTDARPVRRGAGGCSRLARPGTGTGAAQRVRRGGRTGAGRAVGGGHPADPARRRLRTDRSDSGAAGGTHTRRRGRHRRGDIRRGRIRGGGSRGGGSRRTGRTGRIGGTGGRRGRTDVGRRPGRGRQSPATRGTDPADPAVTAPTL